VAAIPQLVAQHFIITGYNYGDIFIL